MRLTARVMMRIGPLRSKGLTMATATATSSPAPAGETLHNVEWATYCKLRDDPANDHLRMTYLDGDLTIVSPQHIGHEIDSRGIFIVVMTVARACRIRFLPVGTTTLRKEGRTSPDRAGKEPDEGFYLGDDVARIRGKTELDLSIDPPPNLAIEVDNTRSSESALPTYARIGVPEVWRFDAVDRTLWFGHLEGDHYEEVGRSINLPRLTPALVLEALEARMRAADVGDWLDWLEPWARALPEPD
jgi:Uma2 family endonuclease